MILVGQRSERFNERAKAGGLHRQLAGFGNEQRTGDLQPVAQVYLFERVVDLERVFLKVRLKLSRGVLQRRKGGFTHPAQQHHPARDGDGFVKVFAGENSFFGVCGVERGGGVGGVVSVRIPLETAFS